MLLAGVEKGLHLLAFTLPSCSPPFFSLRVDGKHRLFTLRSLKVSSPGGEAS
jgi:hypothetical protein